MPDYVLMDTNEYQIIIPELFPRTRTDEPYSALNMAFHRFAVNADLQRKLGLATVAMSASEYIHENAAPLSHETLYDAVAGYLTYELRASTVRAECRKQLNNNRTVRISFKSDALFREVERIFRSQNM